MYQWTGGDLNPMLSGDVSRDPLFFYLVFLVSIQKWCCRSQILISTEIPLVSVWVKAGSLGYEPQVRWRCHPHSPLFLAHSKRPSLYLALVHKDLHSSHLKIPEGASSIGYSGSTKKFGLNACLLYRERTLLL